MTAQHEPRQGAALVPLLLADRSACLRLLVLTELLGRPPDDAEVRELCALRDEDPVVMSLLALQNPDGSWGRGPGVSSRTQERAMGGAPGRGTPAGGGWPGDEIRETAQALVTLGYLGYGCDHPAVSRAAEFLFAIQQDDGSWPLPRSKAERELREPYSTIPLQTGMPLRALAAAGYGSDPRAERGYDWLLRQRLPEGAWPSGVKGGKQVFPAGYRRLALSRFGCRTNTTFAVCALALHPTRRSSHPARQGLGHLLAQENLQAHTLGYEVARTIGVERAGGYFTYFAHPDAALLLDLCWRTEASLEDPRVAALAEFAAGAREWQGPLGLWEYAAHPEASRWVSFDLLRSLSRIDTEGDWVSLQPRLSFQPYPKRPRRY